MNLQARRAGRFGLPAAAPGRLRSPPAVRCQPLDQTGARPRRPARLSGGDLWISSSGGGGGGSPPQPGFFFPGSAINRSRR